MKPHSEHTNDTLLDTWSDSMKAFDCRPKFRNGHGKSKFDAVVEVAIKKDKKET